MTDSSDICCIDSADDPRGWHGYKESAFQAMFAQTYAIVFMGHIDGFQYFEGLHHGEFVRGCLLKIPLTRELPIPADLYAYLKRVQDKAKIAA